VCAPLKGRIAQFSHFFFDEDGSLCTQKADDTSKVVRVRVNDGQYPVCVAFVRTKVERVQVAASSVYCWGRPDNPSWPRANLLPIIPVEHDLFRVCTGTERAVFFVGQARPSCFTSSHMICPLTRDELQHVLDGKYVPFASSTRRVLTEACSGDPSVVLMKGSAVTQISGCPEDLTEQCERFFSVELQVLVIVGPGYEIQKHLSNDLAAIVYHYSGGDAGHWEELASNGELTSLFRQVWVSARHTAMMFVMEPTVAEFTEGFTLFRNVYAAPRLHVYFCGHGSPEGAMCLFPEDDELDYSESGDLSDPSPDPSPKKGHLTGDALKKIFDSGPPNVFGEVHFFFNCCFATRVAGRFMYPEGNLDEGESRVVDSLCGLLSIKLGHTMQSCHNRFAEICDLQGCRDTSSADDKMDELFSSIHNYERACLDGRSLASTLWANSATVYVHPLAHGELRAQGHLNIIFGMNGSTANFEPCRGAARRPSRVMPQLTGTASVNVLDSKVLIVPFQANVGDSTLLKFEGIHILVDGGLCRSGGNVAYWPFISAFGKLDLLVLTHGDRDHVQGLGPLAASIASSTVGVKIEAAAILSTSTRDAAWLETQWLRKDLDDLKVRIIDNLVAGGQIKLSENCHVLFVWPDLIQRAKAVSKLEEAETARRRTSLRQPNRSSVAFIVKMVRNGTTFRCLFTGDADGESIVKSLEQLSQQSKLASFFIRDGKGCFKFDYADVPHHGSSENSPLAFFKSVCATRWVVSTNGMGGHGHPHAQTLLAIGNNLKSNTESHLYFTYPSYAEDCKKRKGSTGFRPASEMWKARYFPNVGGNVHFAAVNNDRVAHQLDLEVSPATEAL